MEYSRILMCHICLLLTAPTIPSFHREAGLAIFAVKSNVMEGWGGSKVFGNFSEI